MAELREIKEEIETGTSTLPDAKDRFSAEVTFGFTTIDRRQAAFAAVRTLRCHFPYNYLIVVDQNQPDAESRAFYAEQNVDVRFVEYDIGLSAARNLMFLECPTPYFFMLDDDVVEVPHEEMRKSFNLIRADDRVLVVGGRYSKISKSERGIPVRKINPPFNNFLFRKPDIKLALLFDPGNFEGILAPRYDKDKNYLIAEVVENFGIFHVAKYKDLGLSWDHEQKIVTEHLDFYFNTQKKRNGCKDVLIVCNPRMIAFDLDAVTDETMADYRKKRYRQEFRAIYARKWNIATEMHLGKWMNIVWQNGQFNSIKWTELQAFGAEQKVKYKRAGEENIRQYGNYPFGNKRISFIATTIDRFDAIQSLAISIRARFGDAVEILFGLQCKTPPEGFADFARALDVRLVPMEYDIGLSAARNRLVEQVDTEYFLLCDDDFVIDNGFHIGNAIRILDNEPEVAGVGGAYRDVIYSNELCLRETRNRHFTFQVFFEEQTSTLIRVPFYHLPAEICYDKGRGALPADILQNLALFRRKDFGSKLLHWDESMKITGEHVDFYIRNLLKNKRKFLFDPGFSVLHNRVSNAAYRQKRNRSEGIERFYKKWNIQFEIDSELGIRAPCRGEERWREIPET